jgi:hypothetical protein
MTTLNNNFNGGPSGTTLTTGNTGQFGDNAFDVVNSSGIGTTLLFGNSDTYGVSRPTGEFMLVTAGGTGSAPKVTWSTSMGSVSQFWLRFYAYCVGVVSSTNDMCLFSAYKSATEEMSLVIRNTASPFCLEIQDSGATITNTSVGVASGAWFRVEMTVNVSAGTSTVNYYAGADVDTNNVTATASQSGGSYGGTTCNSFSLGQDITSSTGVPTIYYANFQLNNTGFPGPAPFRRGLGNPAGNLTTPLAIHSAVD